MTLRRNNIGCYGYKGQAKRTFRHKSWSSGQLVVTFDATFDYLPSGQPLQYTNEADGRLRVPLSAPTFTGGVAGYDERFTDNGCTYTANASLSDKSILQGGKSVVNLLINYFPDSMPLHLRAAQQAAIGSADRSARNVQEPRRHGGRGVYVGSGADPRVSRGLLAVRAPMARKASKSPHPHSMIPLIAALEGRVGR